MTIQSATISVHHNMTERQQEVLTPEVLAFVAELEAKFGGRRKEMLQARADRQKTFNAGTLPTFLPETADIRNGDWAITNTPDVLKDRRVEITGPVDRKMMINAFNSGANVFMADFEDANAPTWGATLDGQVNMLDFARGSLTHTDQNTSKKYSMGDDPAILKVRPRGLHMEEAHLRINGKTVSASLVDFGLHFFHNGKLLADSNRGPFFYIPKLESHIEARWWNEVFTFAEKKVGIPHGTIKVTVLIETLPAAFEMDEILFELKDHIVGLNCGRWDYIFSFIKRVARSNASMLLPDRGHIIMGDAFLKAYSLLLIKTCHKRGAHAMGGMAAQIPIKNDEAANEAAFEKVRLDKVREVGYGHDGTWVAHPALVAVAKAVFNESMPAANQIHRTRDDITITADDLLTVHEGAPTEGGVRENIRIGVQYIAAWLNGRGAVPIYNLMEDAATAEISRTQLWQQRILAAPLADGRTVTAELIQTCIDEEMAALATDATAQAIVGDKLPKAGALFTALIMNDTLEEFLTTPAYELIRTDT